MSDFPDGTYPVNVRNAVLDVNVTNSSIDVNVKNTSINVVVDSGTIDANITNTSINVVVQSGSIDANITNASINVVVDSGTIDANITNASLDVNVLGGTIDANITNATLDVNVKNSVLNVQVSGQASVSIDNASVYLNVKNENFLENRITLENKGSDPAGFATAGLQGKFFPQGCRGIIKIICVYARNTYTTDATIRIHIAIRPGAPAFASYTATVPAVSEGWVYVYPHLIWEYNSIFIYWERVSGNPQVAYDTDTPYDAYFFNRTAEQWQCENRRYWFKIDITGRTSGDIPVSGTVNTINIPNVGSGSGTAATLVAAGSTVTLKEIEGMGTVHMVIVRIDDDMGEIRFYVDGELIQYSNSSFTLRPSEINLWDNYDSSRYIRRVLWDTASPRYLIEWTCPLQFKKSFKIEAYNPRSYDVYFAVEYLVYNKVS